MDNNNSDKLQFNTLYKKVKDMPSTTNNEYLDELNNLVNDYYNDIPIDEPIFNDSIKIEPNNEEPININQPKESFKENKINGPIFDNTPNTESISNPTNIINPKEEIYTPIEDNIEPINLEIPKEETSQVINITIPKDKYHNKTIIVGKNEFDNYLDDTDDKKTLRDWLTNKKIVKILLLIAFISVCIVVAKTFYFGKKVDHYEQFFTEITHKEESMAKVYTDEEIDSVILKKMAASELVNCINSPIDTQNLPESITNIIDEINNYYNRSYNYFAFAYKDLFTGFTVTYNANQPIFTASAIKGPTDICLYEMASEGKIDLDEIVTYTGNYYNDGSGVLKNKPINSSYSIRTLLEYSTVTSDNAAHNMLMDKYGRENILNFWQNLGTNTIFTQNSNWGVMNAHDALIYMSELYNFYARDNEYGEAIMKNFLNAYPTFLKGDGQVMVANKSGWSGTAIHDVAIVFTDNPYIVVALSNTGEGDYTSYFYNANRLAYQLHEEYWKYKINICNNIKQY